jgi:citrate synthase
MAEPAKLPVLMEITKESLETGLRGVPVGYCTTSSVLADKGLFYVGQAVEDISDRDPEDVIFLLFHKRWPSAAERSEFSKNINKRAQVDPAVFASLKALPKSGHPMKWFLHAINALGMMYSNRDYREEALDLVAKIPVVTAAIFRIREGWGEPIQPDSSLGYMENFVHMLGVPGQNADAKAKLVKLMRVFDVVHFDHGGGNLSTFVGKAVASGKADMYESMVGAMAGLAGPLHGRANQECLEFIQECVGKVAKNFTSEDVKNLLQKKMDNKEVVYGFGHAVLRVEDPAQSRRRHLPQRHQFPYGQITRRSRPRSIKEKPKNQRPTPQRRQRLRLITDGLRTHQPRILHRPFRPFPRRRHRRTNCLRTLRSP